MSVSVCLRRVPWRLAAYLNVVGLAGAQDILPVLKAFEAFFVGVLDSGNRVCFTRAGKAAHSFC